MNRLSVVNWLVILGGIIIFTSWIVENNMQSKWRERRDFYMRSQLDLSIKQTQRVSLESDYYKEIRKAERDIELVAFYQKGIMENYLELITIIHSREPTEKEEYSILIRKKEEILKNNILYMKSKNFNNINQIYNEVHLVFGKHYPKLENNFSMRFRKVRKKEAFWNDFFSLLYILGSVTLGFGYCYEHIKPLKKEDKNKKETKV